MNKVLVMVEDNGPGVPYELQKKLFEPYFSTKLKGIGIGLGICRTIIEAHGGELVFVPKPENQGCCFKFTLPLSSEL